MPSGFNFDGDVDLIPLCLITYSCRVVLGFITTILEYCFQIATQGQLHYYIIIKKIGYLAHSIAQKKETCQEKKYSF